MVFVYLFLFCYSRTNKFGNHNKHLCCSEDFFCCKLWSSTVLNTKSASPKRRLPQGRGQLAKSHQKCPRGVDWRCFVVAAAAAAVVAVAASAAVRKSRRLQLGSSRYRCEVEREKKNLGKSGMRRKKSNGFFRFNFGKKGTWFFFFLPSFFFTPLDPD